MLEVQYFPVSCINIFFFSFLSFLSFFFFTKKKKEREEGGKQTNKQTDKQIKQPKINWNNYLEKRERPRLSQATSNSISDTCSSKSLSPVLHSYYENTQVNNSSTH